VEKVVLDQAMQLYDNASNGNRTRGNMKKAQDLYVLHRTSLPPLTDKKPVLYIAKVNSLRAPNSKRLWH
jgi:hypothetical protein